MADNLLKGSIKIDGQQEVVNAFKIVSAGAGKLQTDLQKLSNAGLAPLAGNFQRQVEAQRNFASSINAIPASVVPATAALRNIPNASNQATLALGNLSRIAQDAPFGFIGISNNINPLLESFQRLKATTGSTGGALKALVSSLSGAGGLGLAVGAVSAVMTVFSMGLFDNKKKVEEDTKAVDDFKDEIDDAKRAVDALSKSIQFQNNLGKINLEIDFEKGLTADLIDFGAQVIAINEQLFDLEQRLKPLTNRKIQLEAENKFSSSLNKEIQGLFDTEKELKEKRTILFAQQRLARRENDRKEAEEAKKGNDEFAKLLEARQKILEEFRFRFGQIKLPLPEIDFSKLPKDFELGNKILREGLQDLFNAREDAFKLSAQGISIDAGDLRKALEAEFQKTGQFGGTTFRIPVNTTPELTIQTGEVQKNLKKVLDFFQVQIGGTQRELKLAIELKPILNPVTEEIRIQAEAAAAALAQSLQQAMQQAMTGVFAAVGEGIGAALSGNVDGLQTAFKAIISIMGTLISKIGEALIQYGIVKAGLDKILAGGIAIPGAAIIAAGVAAVAIGSLIKNSQVQGFARGGVVPPGFPGDGFPAMLSSGEKIIPAGQPFGGGERLIATISGTQLRVLLQRTDKSLGRTA